MKTEEARQEIDNHLAPAENLLGFFFAQGATNLGLFFLIGPLAAFSIRSYYVAATNLGIHFHLINLHGGFTHSDFFPFEEIENVNIGKGALQTPMKFVFSNGRDVKIKAQKRGLGNVAKVTPEVLDHIVKNVGQA